MAYDSHHRSLSRNSDGVSMVSSPTPAPTPGIASLKAIKRKPLSQSSLTDTPDVPNHPHPRSTSPKATKNGGYTNVRTSDDTVERHPATKQQRPPVMRFWALELASLALAIGLMAAMLGILIRADGRPTDDWSFPININSLIAILSTVYRAVLVGIATEVVSQFKWVWFWSKSSPARPLRHLSDFDNASRGIWGALRLVGVVATHSFSSLLALIVIILSFATGPFIQQSIHVVSRTDLMPDRSASLPVSHGVEGDELWYRTLTGAIHGMWDFRPQVRGITFAALSNPQSNDTSIVASCSTGDCTFPSQHSADDALPAPGDITHASVGVCSVCSDVTSLVTTVNDSYVELPNGMGVGYDDGYSVMDFKNEKDLSWAKDVIDDEKASQFVWAFANITVLTRRVPDDTDPEVASSTYPEAYSAVSCSLLPCLKSYSASVTGGVLMESVVDTTYLFPDGIDYRDYAEFRRNTSPPLSGATWNITAVQSPCLINGSVFDINDDRQNSSLVDTEVRIFSPSNAPDYPSQEVPSACTYRMNGFIYTMFSSLYTLETFSGNCTYNSRQGPMAVCGDKWWLGLFFEQKNATAHSLTKRFSDFADSMTNQFRTGFGRQSGTQSQVFGRALKSVTYTEVRWPWLILPAVLLIIEIISLGWVIVRSLRHRKDEVVWKSDPLPLLFYKDWFVTSDGDRIGNGDSRNVAEPADGRLMTTSEMEEVSKKIEVKLLRGEAPGASWVEMASHGPNMRQRSLIDQPSDNDTLIHRM